jgi:hypothetical protein
MEPEFHGSRMKKMVLVLMSVAMDAVGKPFAHNPNGARTNEPWHVYPEQAAAGLWTTPTDLAKLAIEAQLAVQGRPSRVLSRTLAREMITRCEFVAHRAKGYGAVIMTNSASGNALMPQLLRLIRQEYKWDSLDMPIPRRYGP